MHEFSVSDRTYLVDESSLVCFSPDTLAKAGIKIWEDNGRNITTDDLMDTLMQLGFDQNSVLEFITDMSDLMVFLDKEPEGANPPRSWRSIELHVAHVCNLGCKYCFAGQGDYGTSWGLMEPEMAFRAVDMLVAQAQPNEPLTVVFFGGEPLVNYDVIDKTIEYISETYSDREFSYSITTNGTLVDERFSKLVRSNKFAVMVSMDGVGMTQDKLRPYKDGRGSSKDIERNVRQVMKGIPVSVRSTITHENTKVFELASQLEQIGFRKVRCSPVSTDDVNLKLSAADMCIIKEELVKLADDYVERKKRNEPHKFYGFDDAMMQIEQGRTTQYGCGAGRRFVAVTPEGDIYPCHRYVGMDAYKMGDIQGGIQPSCKNRYWDETVSKREDCGACWLRNYCGGGCIWEASNADGTITKVADTITCEYRKAVFEVAIDLLSRLESLRLEKESVSKDQNE